MFDTGDAVLLIGSEEERRVIRVLKWERWGQGEYNIWDQIDQLIVHAGIACTINGRVRTL